MERSPRRPARVVVNNRPTETDKWPGPQKRRQDIQDNTVNPVKKTKTDRIYRIIQLIPSKTVSAKGISGYLPLA